METKDYYKNKKMKNRKQVTGSSANLLQLLANLPGYKINSKEAKASKMIKCRAMVFEKQTLNNFEIIF